MSKSKVVNIIRADQVTSFDLWQAPKVDGHTINTETKGNKTKTMSTAVNTPVTAQNLEQIRDSAYQEGLEKGRAEGLNGVKLQHQEILNSLNEILSSCQKQQGNFDDQICGQLVTMTLSIAKQVIRRELSIAPDQIMAVIREAISCLPDAKDKIVLKLHPEDVLLVKETYQLDDDPDHMWTLFEDPSMQKGGCIINTESATVNADLDHRIAMIVTQLLGDERTESSEE